MSLAQGNKHTDPAEDRTRVSRSGIRRSNQKCIQSIAGHPKSIKRLKSGDLLLEVEKQSHVTNLLTTKKIFDLKVKISLHNTLNTSKGVIRCQDLGPCTDDEILDNLKREGVLHVRNIQVRRNSVLKRTNTYVLTFNTPVLPKIHSNGTAVS